MKQENYRLSICIPTYNRAEKLKMMLDSIYLEYEELKDKIQICISNNHSSDNTNEVVKAYQNKMEITYHEMKEDVHAYRNWSYTAQNLADGEYVWVIGDDDIIINGALHRILKLLKEHPSDYYYMNHLNKPLDELKEIIKNKGKVSITSDECECYDLTSHSVDKWEELLTYKGKFQEVNMLYIGNHLFKRGMWNYDAPDFDIPRPSDVFNRNTLDWYYSVWSPQVVNFAKNMMGKPCYYYGEPCVVQGTGENVDEIFSIRFLTFLPRWMKTFEECHIDPAVREKYIQFMDEVTLKRYFNLAGYKKQLLVEHPYCMAYLKDRMQNPEFAMRVLEAGKTQTSFFNILTSAQFEKQLRKLFEKKDGHVVLWGTGDVAKDYISHSNQLKENIDYVVDGNEMKNGKNFDLLQKVIHSPYSLSQEKVFCIVISTVKYESDVIKFIKEHFKYPLYVINSTGIVQIEGEEPR